ncbi:DUF5994 family protein [Streptomyces sp. NPDC047841]|uniref:DUF5994 family protein n=1 Tax=Streptomyces sp. NPDC047841 TaxID=3154708 RepID=UPI0034551BEB
MCTESYSAARPRRSRSRRVTDAGSRRPPGTGRTMDAVSSAADATSPRDAHGFRTPLPRLSVTPDGDHGSLNGPWWPRCEALELELPALVGLVNPAVGTFTHVTGGNTSSPDAPCSVPAPGSRVAAPAGSSGGIAGSPRRPTVPHSAVMACASAARVRTTSIMASGPCDRRRPPPSSASPGAAMARAISSSSRPATTDTRGLLRVSG